MIRHVKPAGSRDGIGSATMRESERLAEACRAIRQRTLFAPDVALILGSGLGDLAESAEEAAAIGTGDIPHYPRSTVAGHRGRLVFGRLEDRRVVLVDGRAHLYEGHSIESVTFPIRLVHALGARRLIVTNAAGGIHPRCRPGMLMLITDHINMTFLPALSASTSGARPARLYDPTWLDSAERAALRLGIRTLRGVYLWSRGPSYETKAEIQAFCRIGADAVGMSTVPEVTQAVALGMKVLGISSITNPAAGLSLDTLSHEDVLRVGRAVRADLERLVRGILCDVSDLR